MSVPHGSLRIVYSWAVRQDVLELSERGFSVAAVAELTGVSRTSIRRWQTTPSRPHPAECPRCESVPLDEAAYAALLGYYLGDGHISRAPRFYALRITCDLKWPAIILDVEDILRRVRPGMRVFRVRKTGGIDLQAHWQHWPCLFPQHGPGRKHLRPIVLDDWQRRIVFRHPAAFLRGLFHSDGARSKNWASRIVAGERRRYDYPRWQFTNVSEDILNLCCWALDLAEIEWKRSNAKTISVNRREHVQRLDLLIGPKLSISPARLVVSPACRRG